jgi:predicted enzyme related to lactoylglutathione lyase
MSTTDAISALEKRVTELEQRMGSQSPQALAAAARSASARSRKLRASLVLCNVPTTDSESARKFYASLLGLDAEEFARGLNDRVDSYFVPLSEDGIDLSITNRFRDDERLTCYFAVDDLDATLAELGQGAAKVVVEPRPVHVADQGKRTIAAAAVREGLEGLRASDSMGRMAVVLDPDGNHVGLMELAAVAQKHFKTGRFATPISAERMAEHAEARAVGATI